MLKLLKDNKNTTIYYLTAFLAGAAILLVEILGTRILQPFFGGTIFVWSAQITATLAFLAIGYVVGGLLSKKYPNPQALLVIFAAAAIGIFIIPLIDAPILWLAARAGFKYGPLVASGMIFLIPLVVLGTVSPFLIRLLTRDLNLSGAVAGRVFAWGTLGSLVGGLAAGFWLVPLLPLSLIFMLSGLIVLFWAILGSLFLNKVNKIIQLFLAVIFVMMVFSLARQSGGSEYLYQGQSFYGDIKLTAYGDYRCLYVNAVPQTCTDREGKNDSDYLRQVAEVARQADPRKILIVGLGGGALLSVLPPEAAITAVELDAAIIDLSRAYGIMPEREVELVIDDARNFIRTDRGSYELIIVDVALGATLPGYLFTREAFLDLQRLLSANGLLYVHTTLIDPEREPELLASISATLESVFPQTTRLISTPDFYLSNASFLAGSGQISDSENLKIYTDKYAIIKKRVRGRVLTDDFNPLAYSSFSVFQDFWGNLINLKSGFLLTN